MLRIKIQDLPPALEPGVRALAPDLGLDCITEGSSDFLIREADHNALSEEAGRLRIDYEHPSGFYRMLNLACHGERQHFATKSLFQDCGAMLDCSRNSVMSVEALKRYMRCMARMGLNLLMLYTEDTYELPQYPYFGYGRGRYTEAEIRELDTYAANLGIELVPCIQTLGHLEKVLRWPFANEIKDTEEVLLCEDEKALAFIEEMLKSCAKLYRSRRVHVGMDEAFGVGTGRYREIYGEKAMRPILQNHMRQVATICERLGLEPMMWSDMPCRAVSRQGYYDLGDDSEEAIRNRAKDIVPPNMAQVYWDYYKNDLAPYQMMLDRHRYFGVEIWFAGGAWTWNGIVPNLQKALYTTDLQIQACTKTQTQHVLCTCWQDNGAEIDLLCALPTLQRWADAMYGDLALDPTNPGRVTEAFRSAFYRCCDLPMEAFEILGAIDLLPGVTEHNLQCVNPAKYFLYQDVELALFDAHVKLEFADHYSNLALRLETLIEQEKKASLKQGDEISNQQAGRLLMTYYARLLRVLELKVALGIQLRDAYVTQDRAVLKVLLEETLPTLRKRLKKMHRGREKLWMNQSKVQGYEVLDIRLGAIEARLKTVKRHIRAYLEGNEQALAHLTEERLTYNGSEGEAVFQQLHENMWHKIVSPNPLSM